MGQRPLAAGRLAGARWRMFERPTASAAAVAGSNLAARGVLKDCGVRFAAMAKDPGHGRRALGSPPSQQHSTDAGEAPGGASAALRPWVARGFSRPWPPRAAAPHERPRLWVFRTGFVNDCGRLGFWPMSQNVPAQQITVVSQRWETSRLPSFIGARGRRKKLGPVQGSIL
jgi:hypothetical protein